MSSDNKKKPKIKMRWQPALVILMAILFCTVVLITHNQSDQISESTTAPEKTETTTAEKTGKTEDDVVVAPLPQQPPVQRRTLSTLEEFEKEAMRLQNSRSSFHHQQAQALWRTIASRDRSNNKAWAYIAKNNIDSMLAAHKQQPSRSINQELLRETGNALAIWQRSEPNHEMLIELCSYYYALKGNMVKATVYASQGTIRFPDNRKTWLDLSSKVSFLANECKRLQGGNSLGMGIPTIPSHTPSPTMPTPGIPITPGINEPR